MSGFPPAELLDYEHAALLRAMTRDNGRVTGRAQMIEDLARLGLVDQPQIRTGRGSGPSSALITPAGRAACTAHKDGGTDS
jgi:hypothetical protein